MLWIKRNLFLVVGGVVALGLVVLGGIYLWNGIQENKAVEGKLEESKAELKRLYDLVPFPSKENIDKAQAELQRLQHAIAQTKTSFTPLQYERVKGQAFTALLATTIDEMQKKAAKAGVSLPQPKYAFTFSEQQKRFQFSEGSFPTLAEQLSEIKAICNILFEAKINKLTALRRGRVTSDDPPAAMDYHELKPERTLPSGAVVSPYTLEINSFSTELAAVLEGFYKSPNGMLVKAIEVKPIDEVPGAPGAQPPPPPPPGPGQPNQPIQRPPPPRRNPGAPGVPGAPPGARTRPVPNDKGAAGLGLVPGEGMKTVLDEKLLRITLWVDVLKPPAK